MSKILITGKIKGEALNKLSSHEVVMWELDRGMSASEIIEQGRGAQAIITLLSDRWTAEVMDEFPNLKIIANYAVGYDNIDLKEATKRQIAVTNTPSLEVNVAVSEFTMGLILAIAKRISEGEKYAKEGLYKGWKPDLFIGNNLQGKTLGIIGLGRIGKMVAKLANTFGMRILYFDENPSNDAPEAEYTNLDDLLSFSDFVSLHIPLLESTKNLINKDKINMMKKGAFLINTARGGIVDEESLVEALESGKLAGVALDVHEKEPQLNHRLMQMDNVILTPHIASATHEVREKMTEQSVEAILSVLGGRLPDNLVNRAVVL